MSPAKAEILNAQMARAPIGETGESALLPSLIQWLVKTGRVGGKTRVAFEVPLNGRRVDLAVLNSKGRTSAFELKLGGFHRVLEQATYNMASCDQSWVVVGSRPRQDGINWAERLGIGILFVSQTHVELVSAAKSQPVDKIASSRVRESIRRKSGSPNDNV